MKKDKAWRARRNKIICERFRLGDTIAMLVHDYGLVASTIRGILKKGKAWKKARR